MQFKELMADAFEISHNFGNQDVMVTNAIGVHKLSFMKPIYFLTGKIANGGDRISLGAKSEWLT